MQTQSRNLQMLTFGERRLTAISARSRCRQGGRAPDSLAHVLQETT